MDVAIEKPDWEILSGMGPGAEAGLEAAGIEHFDEAVKACAVLQISDAASGAEYKVDDLICFLCLSQHKEAVSNPGMPAPARPVSIEGDLGLDPFPWRHRLVSLQAQAAAEAQPASPAPEESAVQPAKARRWRAHLLLLQPLAQPTPRPLVSFAFPLASVHGDMLPWLPIASAISLVQCCRSLHGGGLCFADRLVDAFRRASGSVAAIPARLLHPGQNLALVKAGVTRSTILRTVACAWDWLEKCHPALLDESLLPLALLRLAIRFEGASDHEEAALKLFEPKGKKPALLSFECRLTTAIWGARGLADGVECRSGPLAR